MMNRFFLVMAICVIYLPNTAQSVGRLQKLRYSLDSLISAQEGIFALSFRNLSGTEKLDINEGVVFHAASTMKTAVLAEIFKQAGQGKIKLSDSLELNNEFKSIVDGSPYRLDSADDSETSLYRHLGEKRTISQLMYLMITASSNFATNLLIDKVDARKVTQSLQKMGIHDMKVLRGVEDGKAFQQGLNNVITSADLAILFEKLGRKKLVSARASQAMIDILQDQQFNEMIPARLSKGVKVAHKTGWIKGINHDSGLVFLPDGRKYVLVLLSKTSMDDQRSKEVLALISEMVYHYMVP